MISARLDRQKHHESILYEPRSDVQSKQHQSQNHSRLLFSSSFDLESLLDIVRRPKSKLVSAARHREADGWFSASDLEMIRYSEMKNSMLRALQSGRMRMLRGEISRKSPADPRPRGCSEQARDSEDDPRYVHPASCV